MAMPKALITIQKNHVHLAGRDGGNRVGAEAVDGRLNNDIRNRVHGTLQTGREPDVDHFKPEGPAAVDSDEAHVALAAKQDKEHHDSGGELREYGRERSA